ncbi:hypothetical protein [Bacillus suaedae]|uniref:Uncharacterized protein n=1 Tax=Halalkalibacter suaedae TaxID=2822140 RepID=A0A940WPS8_9BACI|nr:hypothetical protein [Bacillus suaedae]MBP3950300.1 hypothetical protein [Bacillus suaedae]
MENLQLWLSIIASVLSIISVIWTVNLNNKIKTINSGDKNITNNGNSNTNNTGDSNKFK